MTTYTKKDNTSIVKNYGELQREFNKLRRDDDEFARDYRSTELDRYILENYLPVSHSEDTIVITQEDLDREKWIEDIIRDGLKSRGYNRERLITDNLIIDLCRILKHEYPVNTCAGKGKDLEEKALDFAINKMLDKYVTGIPISSKYLQQQAQDFVTDNSVGYNNIFDHPIIKELVITKSKVDALATSSDEQIKQMADIETLIGLPPLDCFVIGFRTAIKNILHND